jgi:hypothetical protein
MGKRDIERIPGNLTPADRARLQQERDQIARELPDLSTRDRMATEAQEEPTLSGAIRRAVHGSGLSLSALAAQAGMTPQMLDEFLTGERTLRSDVLDRLAGALGFEPSRRSQSA